MVICLYAYLTWDIHSFHRRPPFVSGVVIAGSYTVKPILTKRDDGKK